MVRSGDVMTDSSRNSSQKIPKINSTSDSYGKLTNYQEPRTRAFVRKYHIAAAATAGRLRYVHSHRPTLAMSKNKLQTRQKGEQRGKNPVVLSVENYGKSEGSDGLTSSSETWMASEDENIDSEIESDSRNGSSTEDDSNVSSVHPLVNSAARVSLQPTVPPYERRWLSLAPIGSTTSNAPLSRDNFGFVLPYLNDFQPPRLQSAKQLKGDTSWEEDYEWSLTSSMSCTEENYRDGVRRAHENIYLLRNLNRKRPGSNRWSESSSRASATSSRSKLRPLYRATGSLGYDNHSVNCPLCELFIPSKEGHICPPNSPELSRRPSQTTSSLDIDLSDFSSPTNRLDIVVSD